MILKIDKIVLFLCLAVFLFFLLGVRIVAARQQTGLEAAAQANTATVILDAGHGGQDGGAVAGDGTLEKELNLQITRHLSEMLQAAGYRVYLTRSEDTALSENGFHKREDMLKRIALAEEHPEALFISIHLNKYPSEKPNGTQIFYSSNHPQSEALAAAMQRSVCLRLQPENKRTIRIGNENTLLLARIQSPAVLVEGGFLSNPQELSLLKSEDYQKKLAYCLFLGIEEYETEVNS